MSSDTTPGLTLSTSARIGILGDTHGDLEHLLIVSHTMWKRGVSVLLVLGDFGFLWPRQNWDNDLDKLSRRLAKKGQTLFWLDGNHEDYRTLYDKFPISDDGLRRLRSNIIHLPRGYRTRLASGKSLAVLGGANSVDFGHRVVGHSWWPEESITEADLAALGTEHTDVLVGHDAPIDVPSLDAYLTATDRWWPSDGVVYSTAGRNVFHRGFLQVRPQVYLGGHYHFHVDETVDYTTDQEEFVCRVVILDCNDKPSAISQGILDVQTLELQLFTRNDETVTELTGTESGVWHVHTAVSVYILDFDAWTLERRLGINADARFTDHPRPLRSVEICRVGEPAFLSVFDGDSPEGFRWQTTGDVTQIERVEGASA